MLYFFYMYILYYLLHFYVLPNTFNAVKCLCSKLVSVIQLSFYYK